MKKQTEEEFIIERLERFKEALDVIEHQANLESLWSIGGERSLHEAILQFALRHLQAVIEGETALASIYKEKYWHVDDEL